ncbi:putative quinol monooxygenase [Denitrobaculum tricleocarpae]|uniref:Antibiotic biosynthesis monooxygenase n=1 Tax=Denitrobaculum tricleocarpae TaxID=2591009 RepID=A0A545TB62_9PROT|nr:antibiotic biosynthesis monooxygenase [Denitrobaculum tricleocarpae]TQV74453.1 antibiotic biosynthesis monooxygenase [Denitrobaculum tricleocarpae]
MQNLWISAGIALNDGADLIKAQTELQHLMEKTALEPGCIAFEIRQNLERPEHFTLWECWTGEDALKAHFEAPHTVAYLKLGLTKVNYIERLGPIGNRPTGTQS